MNDDLKVVFDFWYLMHGKESKKTRLYVWRAFQKVVYLSCNLKIYEDIRYQDDFDILNRLKFVLISQYLRQFRRYKNNRPHFENLKTRRFRYWMFKLEYRKSCVHEKFPRVTPGPSATRCPNKRGNWETTRKSSLISDI